MSLLTNADLQNLQLSHNLIEDISECPFDSLVHLKKLDLSNNLIKTLGKVHLLAIDAQFINRFKQYTGRVYVMMRIFRKWLNQTTKCTIFFSFFCCHRSMWAWYYCELPKQHEINEIPFTLSHGRIRTQDVQLSSRVGCTPGHSAIPSIKIKADQFQTLASQTWPHWRSLTYRETCSRLASLPCFPASAAASSSSSCPTTGSRASEKPPSCRCTGSGSWSWTTTWSKRSVCRAVAK